VNPALRNLQWASTALDIPARKPLYRLFASLGGFVLDATCFSHGPRMYACAVTLDGVHVPSSPAGGFPTLEAAAKSAKAVFAEWSEQILQRV
jgi:hypothetical protein